MSPKRTLPTLLSVAALAAAATGCNNSDATSKGGVVPSTGTNGSTPTTVEKGPAVPATTSTGAAAQPDNSTTRPDDAGSATSGGDSSP
jgi:hypothetical protein